MTITQYLGTGSKSRGRMTITKRLDTFVALPPYLHDDFDKEAVIRGLENLQNNLKHIPNLTWITPTPNITVTQYVNSVSLFTLILTDHFPLPPPLFFFFTDPPLSRTAPGHGGQAPRQPLDR